MTQFTAPSPKDVQEYEILTKAFPPPVKGGDKFLFYVVNDLNRIDLSKNPAQTSTPGGWTFGGLNYSFIISPNVWSSYPHEFGHGPSHLEHPFQIFSPCHLLGKDPENIMDYGRARNKEKIRKFDADKLKR